MIQLRHFSYPNDSIQFETKERTVREHIIYIFFLNMELRSKDHQLDKSHYDTESIRHIFNKVRPTRNNLVAMYNFAIMGGWIDNHPY